MVTEYQAIPIASILPVFCGSWGRHIEASERIMIVGLISSDNQNLQSSEVFRKLSFNFTTFPSALHLKP